MAGQAVTRWNLAALGCGAALAAALCVYPWHEYGLWLVLLAYAGAVLWRPRLWLPLLLALLPVLDLAPLTGWFFLEELDLLLLLAATCGYARMAGLAPAPAQLPPAYRLALGLLAAIALAGTARALLPWEPTGINSYNNYLSPMNALRVGKPWLWLLILLPLLRRTLASDSDVRRLLLPGMLAGLFLVCCAAIAERMLFPGLTNFSADYRVTAPFSAMHTGGAALDGYLALSVPLLALPWYGGGPWHGPGAAPPWSQCLRVETALRGAPGGPNGPAVPRMPAAPAMLGWAGWLGLLMMALYTVLATFSRGLYAGLAVAALVLLAAALQAHGQWRRWRCTHAAQAGCYALALLVLHLVHEAAGYRALALTLSLMLALMLVLARKHALRGAAARAWGVALLCGAIVAPVASSDYAAMRMASTGSDLQDRLRHWRSVLALMDNHWLGVGMGRFPALYYWNNPLREQPAAYQYQDSPGGGRSLLLLGGDYRAGYGELLRMLQRVEVRPYAAYLLRLEVRNEGPPAFLRPGLCERQLLYPQNCLRTPMVALSAAAGWRELMLPLSTGPLTRGAPVWLELAAEGQRARVAIRHVSLVDRDNGRELLRNGDFRRLQEHWFFSSDHHHLPWHIKNLPLNVYFETGVPGLLALLFLVWSAWAGLRGRAAAAPWRAGLAAFLCVGLFDSLIDVPRIALLFLLLLTASQLRPCIRREVMPGSSLSGKK